MSIEHALYVENCWPIRGQAQSPSCGVALCGSRSDLRLFAERMCEDQAGV